MKVITHEGIFHADEVFAIALLLEVFRDLSIVRSRQEAEAATSDPNVICLDAGMSFDPDMNNFDHHHDANLPSSLMLIMDAFKESFMEATKLDEVGFAELKRMLTSIDATDVNREDIIGKLNNLNVKLGFPVMTINHVISGFNRDPKNDGLQASQFHIAVDFAQLVIENCIQSASELSHQEEVWNNRQELTGSTVLFSEFCRVWKSKVQQEKLPIRFAVMPNPNGWSLNSLDSTKFPIPTQEEMETLGVTPVFVHKGRFIAVFKEMRDVIKVVNGMLPVKL